MEGKVNLIEIKGGDANEEAGSFAEKAPVATRREAPKRGRAPSDQGRSV